MQPTSKPQNTEQPKKQWKSPEIELISVQGGTHNSAWEGLFTPKDSFNFKWYAS